MTDEPGQRNKRKKQQRCSYFHTNTCTVTDPETKEQKAGDVGIDEQEHCTSESMQFSISEMTYKEVWSSVLALRQSHWLCGRMFRAFLWLQTAFTKTLYPHPHENSKQSLPIQTKILEYSEEEEVPRKETSGIHIKWNDSVIGTIEQSKTRPAVLPGVDNNVLFVVAWKRIVSCTMHKSQSVCPVVHS